MIIYALAAAVLAVALIGKTAIALRRGQRPRRALMTLSIGTFLVTVIVGFYSLSHLLDLRAMTHWPTVAGSVIEAGIVGEKAIVPHVVYSYTLDAKTYRGTSDLGTPALGNSAKRMNEAKTLLAGYPVGHEVLVHYNAADPTNSYIVSAVPWNAYMRTGIWIFLIVLATIVFLFLAFEKKKSATGPV